MPNGMSHNQVFLGNLRGFGIRCAGVLGGLVLGINGGKLCQVSEVVTLRLVVKHLRIFCAGQSDDVIHLCEDAAEDLSEFRFHFRDVLSRVHSIPGRGLIARPMRVSALRYHVRNVLQMYVCK